MAPGGGGSKVAKGQKGKRLERRLHRDRPLRAGSSLGAILNPKGKSPASEEDAYLDAEGGAACGKRTVLRRRTRKTNSRSAVRPSPSLPASELLQDGGGGEGTSPGPGSREGRGFGEAALAQLPLAGGKKKV